MNNTLTLSLPISIKMPSWVVGALLLKIVLGLLALAIAVLLGFYLFQMGDLMARSFAWRDHEAEMEGLAKDNANLHIEAVNHFSLGQLEQKISEMSFVNVGQIKYIPIYPKQLVSNVK